MKVENLCKSFKNKVVLDHFSLELPHRGCLALMAPSGSGKTTFMRILARLEKPDKGCIIVPKKRLSMVFQEDRLLPGVTALGNVTAVLDKKQENHAMYWLENMGIQNACHLLPKELSGGMRRRLCVARCMAYGGDLIILDEPFAGLDDETRKNIYPYIFDQSNKDRLTILITHDREEAQTFADRLIVMKGTPLSVVEDIKLRAW